MRRPRLLWKHLYRWYEEVQPHRPVAAVVEEKPVGSNILVLAPRFADDVTGCGGTLRKHAQAGDDVHTLYLTGCSDERIKTYRQVAGIIGMARQTFWEYTEGTLAKADDLIPRLTDLVVETQPDLLYLPSLFESDEDLVTLNHALVRALGSSDAPSSTPMIYAYERRIAMIPNVVVDITDTMEAKQQAMRQCESSGLGRDQAEGVSGLNRYRAVAGGTRLYAEAFYRTTPSGLRRLWTTCYGSLNP